MTSGRSAAMVPIALQKPNTPQNGAVTSTFEPPAVKPNSRATSRPCRTTVRWSCSTNFGA